MKNMHHYPSFSFLFLGRGPKLLYSKQCRLHEVQHRETTDGYMTAGGAPECFFDFFFFKKGGGHNNRANM